MSAINLKKLLTGLIIFYGVFFNLVVILQLQLFNKLYLSYTVYKVLVLVVDVFYCFLVYKDIKIKKGSYQFWFLIFFICILLSFIFGVIRYENISDPLSVLVNNALFIFVIISLSFQKDRVDLSGWIKLIYIYGIINAMFCLAQYFTSSLMLPNYTLNGESIYKSVIFWGEYYRSCGFYTSALEVGILFCFCIYLSLFYNYNSQIARGGVRYIFLILFLFAVYTTKTRNVYVFLIMILGIRMLYGIKSLSKNGKAWRLIIAAMIFGVAVIIAGLFSGETGDSTSTTSIFSMQSLYIRLQEWDNWFNNVFLASNIFEMLFGSCTTQAMGVTTDNYYMELIGAFGIVGLISFLGGLIVALKQLIKSNIQYKEYSVVFLAGMFGFAILNLPVGFFMIYLPLLLLTVGSVKSKDNYNNCKHFYIKFR